MFISDTWLKMVQNVKHRAFYLVSSVLRVNFKFNLEIYGKDVWKSKTTMIKFATLQGKHLSIL